MSQQESNFLRNMVIIVFAGAVVVIGSEELRQNFQKTKPKGKVSRELIQDLQGDYSQTAKGRYDPKSKNLKSQENDQLESRDREQLGSLLERIE